MKVCVGATGVESLAAWQHSLIQRGAPTPFHVTRMYPRRAPEILAGGSLYWTIASRFSVRQRITGIDRVTGSDGIDRCKLDLDPELIAVEPLARRPFQGWRYLAHGDAPADVNPAGDGTDELHRTLAELGLL